MKEGDKNVSIIKSAENELKLNVIFADPIVSPTFRPNRLKEPKSDIKIAESISTSPLF